MKLKSLFRISFARCAVLALSVVLAASFFICSERFVRSEPPDYRPIVALPRALPAITNAQFETVKEADGFLRDSELVLGVTVKGESRAYPINMLTGPHREIINDDLGGRAIAATW